MRGKGTRVVSSMMEFSLALLHGVRYRSDVPVMLIRYSCLSVIPLPTPSPVNWLHSMSMSIFAPRFPKTVPL